MRRDGTVHVGPLGRSNWRAIGFSETDTNGLAIGHSDVSAKTIKDVILSTDSIGLVDEVYEATLLEWRSEIRSEGCDVSEPNLFGQEPQALDGPVRSENVDELLAGYRVVQVSNPERTGRCLKLIAGSLILRRQSATLINSRSREEGGNSRVGNLAVGEVDSGNTTWTIGRQLVRLEDSGGQPRVRVG